MILLPYMETGSGAGADPSSVQKHAKMRPCCLAISSESAFGTGEASHTMTRRWRVLSIENPSTELMAGELVTNMDDPLAVVRDKAASAARSMGFDPQQFILERTH